MIPLWAGILGGFGGFAAGVVLIFLGAWIMSKSDERREAYIAKQLDSLRPPKSEPPPAQTWTWCLEQTETQRVQGVIEEMLSAQLTLRIELFARTKGARWGERITTFEDSGAVWRQEGVYEIPSVDMQIELRAKVADLEADKCAERARIARQAVTDKESLGASVERWTEMALATKPEPTKTEEK